MNLFGLVGIVISKEVKANSANIIIRIGRPFISDKDYDDFIVEVNPKIFKAEINAIKEKDVVAIKGRCETSDDKRVVIIAERLQIF